MISQDGMWIDGLVNSQSACYFPGLRAQEGLGLLRRGAAGNRPQAAWILPIDGHRDIRIQAALDLFREPEAEKILRSR